MVAGARAAVAERGELAGKYRIGSISHVADCTMERSGIKCVLGEILHALA